MAHSDLRTIPIDVELKRHLYVFVECNQFDILNLEMSIWNNGNKANFDDCRLRLVALKRDRNLIVQNTGITVNNNVVKLTTTEQLTTVSGRVRLQLNFVEKETGYIKSSFYIILFVSPSALEIDGMASTSTVTILDQLNMALERVENIGDVLEQALKAMNDLQATIDDSVTKKQELIGTINDAESKRQEVINDLSDKKQEVEDTIADAETKRTNLQLAIDESVEKKEILNNVISAGNILKTELTNQNNQAEKNIDELKKLGDVTNLAEQVETNRVDIADLQEDVANITATGVAKLVSFVYDIEATSDGQTAFKIPYERFDSSTDTLIVASNGILIPQSFYEIGTIFEREYSNPLFGGTGKTEEKEFQAVIFKDGKSKGSIIKMTILKNVPNGEEGGVSGSVIAENSIPMNRVQGLQELKEDVAQISNPNLLINGDFQVWQRGKSTEARTTQGVAYVADRWCYGDNMGTTEIENPFTIKKCSKGVSIGIANATSNQRRFRFHQFVEKPYRFNGTTITFSIKTYSNISRCIAIYMRKLAEDINQSTIDKTVIVDGENISTLTFRIPEDYFNEDDILQVGIALCCGDTYPYLGFDSNVIFFGELIVEWAKLEIGDKATPFIPRSYGEELEDCQRYYQIIRFGGICTMRTDLLPCIVNFPVPMRVSPSYKMDLFDVEDGDSKIDAFGTGDIKFDSYVAMLDNTRLFYIRDTSANQQMQLGRYYDSFMVLDAEIH